MARGNTHSDEFLNLWVLDQICHQIDSIDNSSTTTITIKMIESLFHNITSGISDIKYTDCWHSQNPDNPLTVL